MKNSRAGFTIVEVIIIIAIIVVLAVIAPVGVQETHRRAKVSRIRNDLRMMSISLDKYRADYHCYPAWTRDPRRKILRPKSLANYPPPDKEVTKTDLPTFIIDSTFVTLTTPISYVDTISWESFIKDPYSNHQIPYCYWSTPETPHNAGGWIMWSAGPNKTYDITLKNVAQLYATTNPYLPGPLTDLTYDPSNGTTSGGDIWRVDQ